MVIWYSAGLNILGYIVQSRDFFWRRSLTKFYSLTQTASCLSISTFILPYTFFREMMCSAELLCFHNPLQLCGIVWPIRCFCKYDPPEKALWRGLSTATFFCFLQFLLWFGTEMLLRRWGSHVGIMWQHQEWGQKPYATKSSWKLGLWWPCQGCLPLSFSHEKISSYLCLSHFCLFSLPGSLVQWWPGCERLRWDVNKKCTSEVHLACRWGVWVGTSWLALPIRNTATWERT